MNLGFEIVQTMTPEDRLRLGPVVRPILESLIKHNPQPKKRYRKSVIGVNIKTGKRTSYLSIVQTKRDGIEPSSVGKVCNGTLQKHKGYYWRFK